MICFTKIKSLMCENYTGLTKVFVKINLILLKVCMVTVKYSTQGDEISLPEITVETNDLSDLIERNYRNCISWNMCWPMLSKRKFQGMILH